MKAATGRFIKHMIILLLGSAVLGTLFLVLVFCLPVERMREHVLMSVNEMLKGTDEVSEGAASYRENASYRGIEHYIRTKRETYTDAIMVQNAIERIEGKNAYEHAMWMYHRDVDGEFWAPEDSLRAIAEGVDSSQMYLHIYARYWHGYLIYLKPLLLIFSWKQIIVFGVVLQLVLMALTGIAAVRKKHSEIAVALLIGMLFMKPLLLLVSLTMSVCCVITLTALLFILIRHEWLEEKKLYPEFFLMVGIVTAYFDFLTYPVVTLGFPLCTCFLMKEESRLKLKLQQLIGYCIAWGIGYAGMWGMKWLIADLTLHTGTIKDALWSIIGRTESIGGRPRFNGGFYVIGLNLQEYGGSYFAIAALLTAAAVLALVAAACRRAGAKRILAKLAPYGIIFCIPFVWIIVVQHHSALHARFTFRILAVAVLAVCSMGACIIREIKKSYKNTGK